MVKPLIVFNHYKEYKKFKLYLHLTSRYFHKTSYELT